MTDDSKLEALLAAASLRPRRVVKLEAGLVLAVCSHGRSEKQTRLAVVRSGELLGTWPEEGRKAISLQRSGVLLGGRLALVAVFAGWRWNVVGVEVSTVRQDPDFLRPGEEEVSLIGMDVDHSGRWGMVAHQSDDFPQIDVYDSVDRQWIRLKCTSLIDARISDLRWDGGNTTAIRCTNDLIEKEVQLLIDWDRRVVRWPRDLAAMSPEDANQGLRIAAREGDWATVREHLPARLEAFEESASDALAFFAGSQGEVAELEWMCQLLPARSSDIATGGLVGATIRGDVETSRWALDRGAAMLWNHSMYQTALHAAAHKNHHLLVALLLARGADPHARDPKGRTPRDVAVERKSEEVLKLLPTG